MFKTDIVLDHPVWMVPLVVRLPERASVPPVILVVPFQVFALPERVWVPVPDLVKPPVVPVMLPEKSVLLEELTVSVLPAIEIDPAPAIAPTVSAPPRESVPAEFTVMAEESESLLAPLVERVPALMVVAPGRCWRRRKSMCRCRIY